MDFVSTNTAMMKLVLPKLGINPDSYREPYFDQDAEIEFMCQQSNTTKKSYYRFTPSSLYTNSVVLLTSDLSSGAALEFDMEEKGILDLNGKIFKTFDDFSLLDSEIILHSFADISKIREIQTQQEEKARQIYEEEIKTRAIVDRNRLRRK